MSEQFDVRSIDDALSMLGGVADFVAGAQIRESHDLIALLKQLTVLRRRVDATTHETVRRFDASGAWELDGAGSAQAWMRGHLRMTPGAARRAILTARRIDELPLMKEALRRGEISTAHVRAVATVMQRNEQRRATVAVAEPTFLEAARRLDPAQLGRVVARWTHTVDPLGALANEQAIHDQRYLRASRTSEGAVRIDGLLGPEQGSVVLTALEAVATTEHRTARATVKAGGVADERAAGQRRADAFVDVCRSSLDLGFAPEIAGMRPHVQVTVPLATLASPPDGLDREPAELEGVGPVSGDAARRIACDALVAVMGLDAEGKPLTYGRSRRTVDARLRKVLNKRDGGCRFPGCDRPVAWTQAHHLVHWSRGGPTDPDNLALICSFHHHRLHEGGFTTRGSPESGTLTFHRPDGSRIRDPEREPRPG